MFIAEDVSFQLELYLLNGFAAVVDDVNIDVDAGSAHPHLPMQACSDSDNFHSDIARFYPLI